MTTKKVVIEIDVDGSVKIEGHGFVGMECTKATGYLEEALGVKKSGSRKPEYYHAQNTTARKQS